MIQVALADPDASADSLRAACEQLLALGEQQERLIDALLTLASSHRGPQKHKPFDLAEIVSRVVDAHREDATRRDIRLETSFAAAAVTGDPSLAESLVTNLVDNAIRHNVTGGLVGITTAIAAGAARLSVSTTGPVIPPGQVERLFQPFQQLDGERTRHDGGHGLGLAIVASIASAHSATLAARPRPEGGLDITVTFPRAAPEPATAAQHTPRGT